MLQGKEEVSFTQEGSKKLQEMIARSTSCHVFVNDAQNIILWHRRLTHSSLGTMKLMKDINVCDKASENFICDNCHYAKQKRNIFPKHSYATKETFKLIHCDIWGPFSKKSIEGYNYF